MPYIKRILNLKDELKYQSLFLFGARQTGKTSYINNELKEDVKLQWTLLDSKTRRRADADPSSLRDEIYARQIKDGIVVIDEIQKVPELLDEIHLLIEETDIHFLLTGSSARKLREKGINLLGGRAGKYIFHPLVYPEIKDTDPTLEMIFRKGLLPSAYLSEMPEKILSNYVDVFLREEIAADAAVRKLPQFEQFLEIAAISNAEELNYSNIARDIMMSRQAVYEWYRLLVDTLIGFEVPAYTKTLRRKAVETSRFYFFDIGVVRSILGIDVPLPVQTEYGKFFENYIAMELRAYLDYNDKTETLSYWRTRSGLEVDFTIGNTIAIETKTTKSVSSNDLKGLRALKEENVFKKFIIVSRDETIKYTEDGILLLPWHEFLEWLWRGDIL